MAIVSVVATINGQSTNLTRDASTGKWSGTITIPEHAGYTDEITFTATNGQGLTATNDSKKIYIFVLLTFITDRGASDVAYIQELLTKIRNGTITEEEMLIWQSDLKGALNKSDITRIHNNLELAITNYFSKVDTYADSDVDDILDLITDEIPLKEHFQYILTHLTELRAWAQENDLLEYDVPEPPNFPLNNLQAWNNIEAIIERIYLRTIDHHI